MCINIEKCKLPHTPKLYIIDGKMSTFGSLFIYLAQFVCSCLY